MVMSPISAWRNEGFQSTLPGGRRHTVSDTAHSYINGYRRVRRAIEPHPTYSELARGLKRNISCR